MDPSQPPSTTYAERVKRFSPRAFLQARRPERFSDSRASSNPVLDRSILEYHLESLANRSQELAFEHFARKLAQHAICPNLLPHTGPTGGGDSKVDSETYPIADSLALAWFTGIGREASRERWAFAFSIQKSWRKKVTADVQKIASVGRGYSKAFFISSRFIRDKDRANVEDNLSSKLNLDVRILDRTWILDKVFELHLEPLAISELHLKTEIRSQVVRGPQDAARELRLETLEREIQLSASMAHIDAQFVASCLEAAQISRGLDRPKIETEGRFARARDAAKRTRLKHPQLLVAYQQAWTYAWWYEDYSAFLDAYLTVERLATETQNVYHLELLSSLWYLLHAFDNQKLLTFLNADLTATTAKLRRELSRFTARLESPSAALQARALLLCIDLQERVAANDTQGLEPVLADFESLLRESAGLIGFPLLPLTDILLEVGSHFDTSAAFPRLFETIVNIKSSRDGDVSAGCLLLERAHGEFEAGRYYSTIRLCGRALSKLCKHESRAEFCRLLLLIGAAYEQVGLLWAARGSTLNAASEVAKQLETHEHITAKDCIAFRRMKWIELQLGRLPHLLTWHEIDLAVRNANAAVVSETDFDEESEAAYDLLTAIALLRLDLSQLKDVVRLPNTLDRLGLIVSGAALKFALGHEESAGRSLSLGEAESDLSDMFLQFRDHPAALELRFPIELCQERTLRMESRVLGCHIVVRTENSQTCIRLAQTFLAAIEATLATAWGVGIAPREPLLSVSCQDSEFCREPFDFAFQDDPTESLLTIRCRKLEPPALTLEDQAALRLRLQEMVATVVGKMFLFSKPIEQVLDSLLTGERVLERAICFTGSFITEANVVGTSAKTSTENWLSKDGEAHVLKRSEPWDSAHGIRNAATAPGEYDDKQEPKHSDFQLVSIINVDLWNRAQWHSTGFLWDTSARSEPTLALIFKDTESAKDIFRIWRTKFGTSDRNEVIRISIIRRIARARPHDYRVIVGCEPTAMKGQIEMPGTVMSISRVNTMKASTDINLDSFLRNYDQVKSFRLSAGYVSEAEGKFDILENTAIQKRVLHLREAWEVGRHDPDCIAIRADDEPALPAQGGTAPIFELLHWLRTRRPRSPQ